MARTVKEVVSAGDPTSKLIEPFEWYQTIDIDGTLTPGRFDHRPFLRHYHLPSSLEGRTVLDVGCADGFFAFEFERLGARTVLAIDAYRQDGSVEAMDYSPALYDQAVEKRQASPGPEIERRQNEAQTRANAERPTTFHMAKALLGSEVDHRFRSIYDLHELGRTYDLVFCGTVSEHLKNLLGALEQLRHVTQRLCIFAACGMILPPPLSSGKALLAKTLEKLARTAGIGSLLMLPEDTICRYTGHDHHNSFFRCTTSAMKAMLMASGFARVELKSTFWLTTVRGTPYASPHAVFHCYVEK